MGHRLVFRLKRRGFTLIELLVVVLIIGTLAAMGIGQYAKTMEIAKADDALAVTQAIANANRMYALDHGGVYLDGNLSTLCADPAGTSTSCSGTAANACDLMYCGYLARQNLSTKSYEFFASNGTSNCGATAAGLASCAKRKSDAVAPFNTWGFASTRTGSNSSFGTEQPPVH